MKFFTRVFATTVFWALEYPQYSWREAWRRLEWRRKVIENHFPNWRKRGQ